MQAGMGISGLLQALRPITTGVHVRDLAGLRVGVDAYVWLHRSAYGCAADLCQGVPTRQYLNYLIGRLNLLLEAGVHVYLVFDGGPLPAKKGTEHERRARREESRRRALQCLGEGNRGEAFGHFSKAVDVTPAMAKEWIRTVAGVANVSYVVAPYEADAQLAFLAKAGLVDAVITEDSDILAFGCPRVLFKLDQDGHAQQILHADLFRAPIEGLGDLRGWDEEAFLRMCILSGCDYLPSVPGMGLRSAYRLLTRHRQQPDRALRALRLQQFGKGKSAAQVPPDYEAKFREAFLTFRHQRVFDPQARGLAHLHPLPPDLAALPAAELEFLGPPLEAALAVGIADGELDPISLKPFPAPSAIDAALPGPKVAPVTVSQPRISAYLKKLPARPPAPPPAPAQQDADGVGKEEEEQEGETEAAATTGAAGAISNARPVSVYQTGLRKSAVPVRSQKGVGGYLRRTAAALKDATASATAGLLPRKRPAPTTTSTNTGGGDEEGGAAATGCLPLPQVSSWFGGGGGKAAQVDDKENAAVAAAPASTAVPVRRSAFALPSKRPRTLGAPARPLPAASSSSLASFKFRGLGGRGVNAGGGGDSGEEQDEDDDNEQGERGQHAASSGDEGGGGAYGDSLMPPTPGTPFVGAAAAPPRAPAMPDEEEEEQQQPPPAGMRLVGDEAVCVTAGTVTTTTGGGTATAMVAAMAYSSIFEELSFSAPSSSSGARKTPQQTTTMGPKDERAGAGASVPLASLAPNTMTPSTSQRGAPQQPQRRPRRASVAEEEDGGGARDAPQYHRTPTVQAAAAAVSFSFEAFQFSATDASALLTSASASCTPMR